MYTEEDIDSAVKAGVLTRETATAFRQHVAALNGEVVADEEHFRLITGFNDIFVVIACGLLLIAVSWIGSEWGQWFGSFAAAATAWLLAEFFVLRRRMALPAIVLLLAFVGNMFATGLYLFHGTAGALIGGSILASIAAGLHWYRFKVPVTVAAGSAAVVGCFVGALLLWTSEAKNWIPVILFICGVAVFFLAMWWDSRDTVRQTRKSDVAFWLHLLAAPLLVHPIFSLIGVFEGRTSPEQAMVVIVLYALIALISLGIDRRALMVSSLIYVLYTFSTLLEQIGVVSLGFAITALFIGTALLFLSAFWHTARSVVLRFFPHVLAVRLPPSR